MTTCPTALFLFATLAHAAVDRVVIVKVDGLPPSLIERAAPQLPNLQRIFGQNGAKFDNFYVRGLSISAPSWSMLDTGRPLEIRGNVEYDRYTLRSHDYLNFLPFYLGYATSHSVDMPGVRLLDELGIPLLLDRFPYQQRFQAPQLMQRGVHWTTFGSSLKRMVTERSPRALFDEWETGFSITGSIMRQTEHEVIEALKNPDIHYVDFFTGDYDHVAHLTADRDTQLHEIQEIDALLGRLWTAIEQSPYPRTTVLILISDHGMNTVEGVYSQGFSFVDWFASAAGGAHHVLTNRHPMTEFKLKALYPFVHEVITPSAESSYLEGQSAQYPTAILDLDGNERASISLRNNTLNQLQILLDQLTAKRLTGPVRTAALKAFFAIRDAAAPDWSRDLDNLSEELATLDRRMEELRRKIVEQPRNWTSGQKDLGLDKDARRQTSALETWKAERRADAEYAATIRRLLALQPSDFDPGKFKMETIIPPKSLGPPNSLADLQNYVVGPAPGGLVRAADGSLDLDRSFRRIDYFPALEALAMRNNVQAEVSARPVDFTAVRVPREQLAQALPAEDAPDNDGIWLRRSASRQALILTRRSPLTEPRPSGSGGGPLDLRYVPISGLTQQSDGSLHFDRPTLDRGFPLELWEDPQLTIPPAQRAEWLNQWHTEREWFEAIHRTRYSNGLLGLVEALLDHGPAADKYADRKRRLRRTDLLVFANDHWNFNVRGFNPGGNHGSLLRVSTRSVLQVAGGEDTAIPRGVRIETPYDSLSFVPTILALMGRPEPDLPGPVIRELVGK